MPAETSPTNSGRAHLDAAREFFELLNQKDVDAWGKLWHEQGKIIVPYPAEGFPELIEGKAVRVVDRRESV